jgi:hypothetical protein
VHGSELAALVCDLRQEVADLRREVVDLRQQVGYWRTMHARAVEKGEKLQREIDLFRGENRQMKDRLYGTKSEKHDGSERFFAIDDLQAAEEKSKRRCGQQPQTPGPRRRDYSHLPVVEEPVAATHPRTVSSQSPTASARSNYGGLPIGDDDLAGCSDGDTRAGRGGTGRQETSLALSEDAGKSSRTLARADSLRNGCEASDGQQRFGARRPRSSDGAKEWFFLPMMPRDPVHSHFTPSTNHPDLTGWANVYPRNTITPITKLSQIF